MSNRNLTHFSWKNFFLISQQQTVVVVAVLKVGLLLLLHSLPFPGQCTVQRQAGNENQVGAENNRRETGHPVKSRPQLGKHLWITPVRGFHFLASRDTVSESIQFEARFAVANAQSAEGVWWSAVGLTGRQGVELQSGLVALLQGDAVSGRGGHKVVDKLVQLLG